MIITYSTRWSPTAAPPSTGGGTFPFVHLSPPLPCDHTRNIWFRRAPYTCLCLIKRKKKKNPRPGTSPRSFPLFAIFFCLCFFFFFTGMVKIRTGNSRRGQILCNLQEAAAQRTERSHERQKTELSIIRTPREWSARISTRGARYVNEGNFHKLGLTQTEAATEIHEETVREIRGRVQKTDNQFKYHTYLHRKPAVTVK